MKPSISHVLQSLTLSLLFSRRATIYPLKINRTVLFASPASIAPHHLILTSQGRCDLYGRQHVMLSHMQTVAALSFSMKPRASEACLSHSFRVFTSAFTPKSGADIQAISLSQLVLHRLQWLRTPRPVYARLRPKSWHRKQNKPRA